MLPGRSMKLSWRYSAPEYRRLSSPRVRHGAATHEAKETRRRLTVYGSFAEEI